MSCYVHLQMAGILKIWELTWTIFQCQGHTTKLKLQRCLKMLCCIALCGSEWLSILKRLILEQAENWPIPYFQVKCHSNKVIGQECLKMPCCTTMGWWLTMPIFFQTAGFNTSWELTWTHFNLKVIGLRMLR